MILFDFGDMEQQREALCVHSELHLNALKIAVTANGTSADTKISRHINTDIRITGIFKTHPNSSSAEGYHIMLPHFWFGSGSTMGRL